ALLVSTLTIRAWARVLRNTRATSMPGRSMSPVYLARPVTRSSASMFGPLLPTTFRGPPGTVFCWAVFCCAMVDLYARIRRDAAMTDSRIFLYAEHRHRLPLSASRAWSSVGFAVLSRNTFVLII